MQQKSFIMQSVIGWVLSLVLVVLISQSVYSRRLDCTKFVFAPRCRGVAAKRGLGADLALYPSSSHVRTERKRNDAAAAIAGPAYNVNSDGSYGGDDWLSLALSQQPAGSLDLASSTQGSSGGRKQRLRQLALKLLQMEADLQQPQTQDAWPVAADDAEYRED